MDRITDLGAFGDKMPNHVLVNEYLAGQGIMVSSLFSYMEKNNHHQYLISLFSNIIFVFHSDIVCINFSIV